MVKPSVQAQQQAKIKSVRDDTITYKYITAETSSGFIMDQFRPTEGEAAAEFLQFIYDWNNELE